MFLEIDFDLKFEELSDQATQKHLSIILWN